LLYSMNAQAQEPPQDLQSSASQAASTAAIIYEQPPNPSGGLFLSSWLSPGESNYDEYVWDNFTLASGQVITEVQWRGGYDPAKAGSGGPVLDFTVAIYLSTIAGAPDLVNPAPVQYQTGGNAGQTLAGTFGGVTMYDYVFTLPAPFYAAAGTKYWVYIVAVQQGNPDWGLAVGTGGDGIHYRKIHILGYTYQWIPGDAAFKLLGPPEPITGLSATNNSPTAPGYATTFTATVSTGNGVSYAWNFGDQTTGSGQVVTHTYAAVGDYTAVVTASNPISSVTATTTVVITSALISGLTASNDSPMLLGSTTTLTASVTSGNGVAYTWNLGDGQIRAGQVITYRYASFGIFTAIVTATNTLNQMSAATTVTITAPYHTSLPLVLR